MKVANSYTAILRVVVSRIAPGSAGGVAAKGFQLIKHLAQNVPSAPPITISYSARLGPGLLD